MTVHVARSLVSGNNRAPLAERKDDLYETPPEAVRALLKSEEIPHKVWEPACGPGAIVKELRASGRDVVATDLVAYGCPDSQSRRDFLMERKAPQGVTCIVTNPPFKLADEFLERATALVPLVVMLLRLEFIAGVRGGLLDRLPPARIHAFRNRLPRMHRHGYEGPKATSRLNFAWFVWDRAHQGPTELRRISWEAQ